MVHSKSKRESWRDRALTPYMKIVREGNDKIDELNQKMRRSKLLFIEFYS